MKSKLNMLLILFILFSIWSFIYILKLEEQITIMDYDHKKTEAELNEKTISHENMKTILIDSNLDRLELLEVNNTLKQALLDIKNEHEKLNMYSLNFKGTRKVLSSRSIIYAYLKEAGSYTFINKKTDILELPYEGAPKIKLLPANTLVRVIEKSEVEHENQNNQFWYYVSYLNIDKDASIMGWVSVKDTRSYNTSNRIKVRSPVKIKNNAKVYLEDPSLSADTAFTPYEALNTSAHILTTNKDYVQVYTTLHERLWLKKTDILYPDYHE